MSYDVVINDRKRRDALRQAAVEFVTAMTDAAEKYRALVDLIRVGRYTADEVREELLAAGLPPSRISELRRIAESSEALYQAFKDRLIGFKPALAKAREEKAGQVDEVEKQDRLRRRKWNLLASAIERLWEKHEPIDRAFWLNGRGLLLVDQETLKKGGTFRLGKFKVTVELWKKEKSPRKIKTK